MLTAAAPRVSSAPAPRAAPAPVAFSTSPTTCPRCGASSTRAGAHDVDAPWRCGCGVDVGFREAFVDDDGHLLPMRLCFRATSPGPSACCGDDADAILVGVRSGTWCGACGGVALGPPRSDKTSTKADGVDAGLTRSVWQLVLSGGVGPAAATGIDPRAIVGLVVAMAAAVAAARLWLGAWPV